jgi:hypothetical protein
MTVRLKLSAEGFVAADKLAEEPDNMVARDVGRLVVDRRDRAGRK